MRQGIVMRATKACVLIGFLLNVNLAYAYPLVPDPRITQGEVCTKSDPDFSYYRYQEKIPYCERNVDWHQREKIYDKYKIPSKCRGRYTIDHLIPLSIGGNNSDANLWPEHKLVKATRPLLEQELFEAVKRGELTQKEAIDIIVSEKNSAKESLMWTTFKRGCDQPSAL